MPDSIHVATVNIYRVPAKYVQNLAIPKDEIGGGQITDISLIDGPDEQLIEFQVMNLHRP